MNFKEKVQLLTIEALTLMPSSGIKPFTIAHLSNTELPDFLSDYSQIAESFIFILLKPEYSGDDFIDYSVKTKEFSMMSSPNKAKFLNLISARAHNPAEIQVWKEMVASIATGLVMHKAKGENIFLKPIEGDKICKQENTGKSLYLNQQQIFKIYAVYLID